MKKPIKILLGLIFLFVIIGSLSLADAQFLGGNAPFVTVTTLDNASILNVTFFPILFDDFTNETTNSGGVGAYAMNITVFASSPSTANSSLAIVFTFLVNPFPNGTEYLEAGGGNYTSSNATILANGSLQDSNDYTFLVITQNDSAGSQPLINYSSVSTTGVLINYTIPTAPISLTPADGTTDNDGSITFFGNVTGNQTTACTLEFIGTKLGSGGQSMVHTENECRLTITNVPDQTYNWFIRASDGDDTADSASQTITADVQTSSGKAALLAQQRGVTSIGGSLLSIAGGNGGKNGIGIIIVLGIVGWLFFRKPS